MLDGIKAIIFDLDGTLYDSSALPVRLVMARPLEMFLMRAERVVRSQLKGMDLKSPDAFYNEFLSRLSVRTGKNEKELRSWYFTKYMPLMLDVLKKYYHAYSGVLHLFDLLRESDISFAVYSDYPNTAARLEALGLNPSLCGSLYSPEDFGALKPAERPFRLIAADLEASCDETLVIGDRDDTDGAGARSCGMPFLQVKTRKNRTKKKHLNELYTWDSVCTMLAEHAAKKKLLSVKRAL
ncbi:HAD family hydrolase [Treponema sp. OttesenSCG-928-L16]|nr:HAD family hydrolase [Treponema sp. OttesenSCG-928-L16]